MEYEYVLELMYDDERENEQHSRRSFFNNFKEAEYDYFRLLRNIAEAAGGNSNYMLMLSRLANAEREGKVLYSFTKSL